MNTTQITTILTLSNEADWATHFQMLMPKYDISTDLRQSYFLAQTLHESAGLTRLVENLNYSSKRLVEVFPKYFPNKIVADRYAGKPERIANRVYANRMDNGDEWSGDGWKYRGRGPIMITGKRNYRQVSRAIFGDERLLEDPDLLLTPSHGAAAACWWWKSAGCNALADVRDFKGATKRLNGGLNGYADRLKWLARLRALA